MKHAHHQGRIIGFRTLRQLWVTILYPTISVSRVFANSASEVGYTYTLKHISPLEGEWLRPWKIQGNYYWLEFYLQQLLFREFPQTVLRWGMLHVYPKIHFPPRGRMVTPLENPGWLLWVRILSPTTFVSRVFPKSASEVCYTYTPNHISPLEGEWLRPWKSQGNYYGLEFCLQQLLFREFPQTVLLRVCYTYTLTAFPPWLRPWKIQGDYYGLEFCLQQLLFREFFQTVVLRYATRIPQTTFPPLGGEWLRPWKITGGEGTTRPNSGSNKLLMNEIAQ